MTRQLPATLPIGPLLEWRKPAAIYAHFLDNDMCTYRSVQKAAARGTISPRLADRVVTALGSHVDVVWPGEFPVPATVEEAREARNARKRASYRHDMTAT